MRKRSMTIQEQNRFSYALWLCIGLIGMVMYMSLDSAGQSSLLFALYQFMGI